MEINLIYLVIKNKLIYFVNKLCLITNYQFEEMIIMDENKDINNRIKNEESIEGFGFDNQNLLQVKFKKI